MHQESHSQSTGSTGGLNGYAQFARFVIVTFEWDHADGGTCDLEVLVVPKR